MATSALNCEDLPEASMPGGCGPASRRLGYRADRYKCRIKSLPLPLLREDVDTQSELEQPMHPSPADAWHCCACSFTNHGLMSACEICAIARGSAGDLAKYHTSKPPQGLSLSDEWPSLREAADSFIDCELSSVASSWLAVGGAEFDVDDEEYAIIAPSAAEHTTPVSWAARAKPLADGNAAVMMSAGRMQVPPLFHKKVDKVRNVAGELGEGTIFIGHFPNGCQASEEST